MAREKLDLLADFPVVIIHYSRADGDRHIRIDTKPNMIGCRDAMREGPWRLTQAHDDLRASHGQGFACADEERHALPAPGVDLQPQRGEVFRVRVRRDTGFLPIAAKLTA